MSYFSKMVQIPPNISIPANERKANKAAIYLEQIVSQYAEKDWEFFRIDCIGVRSEPGCLASFLGQRAQIIPYYVITFRRPK